MALTLQCSTFANGSPIPKQYTCDGAGSSPPLSWQDAPAGTKSFALICDDPDAQTGTFVHWVIYGLPPNVLKLAEGVPASPKFKDGSLHGKNDFNRLGYAGPCPPQGKSHRYFFRLYALDISPVLNPGLTRFACLKTMEGHVLAKAEWMGTYSRA